jgi:L-asparaginase/Glu-tRNA(Gln) amidotransferase subunit D
MSSNQLHFQAGGTLNPRDSVYVNRSEDQKYLTQALRPRAWINVYGCRTMGKSSLYVRHLQRLSAQGIRSIAIDVAGQVASHAESPRDWLTSLAEAIASELSINKEFFAAPIKQLPKDVSAGLAMETLFELLLPRYHENLFLIFDEYDRIGQLDYGGDLLSGFRHIQSLQSRSKRLDRLSISFVGLRPLTDFGAPGEANSSQVASPIRMVDFDNSEETIETLQTGFVPGRKASDSVIRHVLSISGGQPLVTMELLREVQTAGCRTIKDVDRAARRLVSDSGLGVDLDLFKTIEKSFIAKGEEAFAALSAYKSLLTGSREAHSAPGTSLLSLYGLVRQRDNELEVKGELFRRRFDVAWAERMLSRVASRMQQYRGGPKSRGKRICVINTGGTLGMVERGDKVVPPRDANEFRSYFTALGSIAEIVEFTNLFPPRDSINVFPDQWTTIARYIYSRRNAGFDGFVVAHGTDTMAYSASAVAFALGPQLSFPVVFTGAQTTPDVAYGDAHVNLYRACEVAKHNIPEVVISFGNFVYRAVRAQKKDDRRFDGFESPTYPPLAEITGEINVRHELLRELPKKGRLELRADFEKSILIVPQFPGLEPSFFEHLLKVRKGQHTCHGVIVQTLGAGNVSSEPPYSFIPFVERAFHQGIPVIVTSQYPPDPGSHTKYTPAQAPIVAGAIHAGNMTLAAAVTKFRWVLADVLRRKSWQRLQPEKKRTLVAELMVEKSVIGEF